MTGASKLIHTRRIRFSARNNSVADSSIADGNSSHRTTTDRRRHHRNNRQDLGGCNSIHSRAISDEHGRSQPPSGSIINSEDFRSIRRRGTRESESERLPGVVLLARERLLERLRGVHVSENRQSSTSSSSSIHRDVSSQHSFLETNTNPLQESVSESWQAVMPLSPMTRMLPGGLSKHQLNLLSVTVFTNVKEESNESCNSSRECSICLEGFEDGEKLINLRCMHSFHSCCLLPWVEVCGACPNCRKDIDV